MRQKILIEYHSDITIVAKAIFGAQISHKGDSKILTVFSNKFHLKWQSYATNALTLW